MKPTQELEMKDEYRIFSLAETTDRGTVKEIVKNVDPLFLEMAEAILENADKNFESVDHNVLFPLADHLAFTVKRVKNHEEILNPLLNDIKILFSVEFKSAEIIRPLLKEKLGLSISDDEIGYVALHIHSAISSDKLSQSLETAQAVRHCINQIEEMTGMPISLESLSYNRMMNHIRYMVARVQHDEPLKISMNDYVESEYPKSFEIAKDICAELGRSLKKTLSQAEIGYLALHIERVKADVLA